MRGTKGERRIAKIKIFEEGFGTYAGEIVNVYGFDSEGRAYYYDGFRRWCYVNSDEYEIVKDFRKEKNNES
jgi:hypothetical protein